MAINGYGPITEIDNTLKASDNGQKPFNGGIVAL